MNGPDLLKEEEKERIRTGEPVGGKYGEGIKWKDKTQSQKGHSVAAGADSLKTLADLGKKAFGTSDEMRAAYSAQIANTDPVKKGGPQEKALSTRVDWKDDTSSTSPKKVTENTSPLPDADLEYQKKKKKNGL